MENMKKKKKKNKPERQEKDSNIELECKSEIYLDYYSPSNFRSFLL